MNFRYELLLHFLDLISDLRGVLYKVSFHRGLSPPRHQLLHGGLLVSRLSLGAEDVISAWLKGVEELHFALLQLLIVNGKEVLGGRELLSSRLERLLRYLRIG